MLESLTIFSKGGLIFYQYQANPSLVNASDGAANTCQILNESLIKKILTDPSNTKTFHIVEGITLVWKVETDFCIVALYPDILFEGPRQYLKNWSQGLIEKALQEYKLYHRKATENDEMARTIRPDPAPYDKTFQVLLKQSKGQEVATTTAPSTTATTTTPTATQKTTAKKTGGKEKRNWHDGNAKVTEKAMAELDRSAEEDTEEKKAERMERALQEARQAYLPDPAELVEEEEKQQKQETEDSWGSAVTGLFQQLTGNKVLTSTDLEAPLQQMEELLTSKNVAREIAHELCQAVRAKLEGKRLNSMYRVQTAVQQALESVLQKLLQKNQIDLLRAVVSKRGDGSLLSALQKGRKRTPYVVVVMGINGIGKTTTLAKLAYYFQQNGCKPLLVAGDTFRSGAVEQLQVHASCLEIPLFSHGYSKDPSAVAKAAIQKATEDQNDVVLIDTAGRMQNNVPLMKALGKLVNENKPDLCLFVCEALVGNDGLDQYQMFRKAIGGKVDGLILTKMDTVADKVGAALTLTHQTGTPIVFCGTGQKYHHLSPLSVSTTVRSLLSASS